MEWNFNAVHIYSHQRRHCGAQEALRTHPPEHREDRPAFIVFNTSALVQLNNIRTDKV